MPGLDAALLAVGRAVMTRGATAWLRSRRDRKERSAELVELIIAGFPRTFDGRRLHRQLEAITDDVAQRLGATCEHEFRDLRDNEKEAALAAVVDTLTAADLSDDVLFTADMDGTKLLRILRPHAAHRQAIAGLGEAGRAFFDRVLADSCGCLVVLVTELARFEPRATAETLSRLSTLSTQLGEVLSRLPRVTLDAPTGTNLDAEFERRYLRAISDGLDSLELLGLPGKHRRPRLKLTMAYLSLTLSTGGGSGRHGARTERLLPDRDWLAIGADDGGDGSQTIDVEIALARTARTLVRGEAGSGKTTLLRWLAVTAARSGFTGDLHAWNGLVPFLVTLRRYTDKQLPAPEHLLDDEEPVRLIAGMMPAGWTHRQFLDGRALLLVDGVDELTEAKRERVREWLGHLLATYPETRLVVTSRPTAATEKWLERHGFAATSVARMTPADVREFVRRWHVAAAESDTLPCRPDELPAYESALLRHFAANPSLRALAANPLLCSLLCALNLDRDTQLPTRRMALYETALELLLERRDATRGIPDHDGLGLDYKNRIELVQGLAWWLAVNNQVELRRDTALQSLSTRLTMLSISDSHGAAVLRHLLERSGVIREPVLGRVDFVHRTFQEYLAAKEAADNDHVGLLVERAHLDRWWETVVLAAGHGNVPFRTDLLTGLLDRADMEKSRRRHLRLLAAACLETAGPVAEPVRARVEAALDEMVPPRHTNECISLASGGDAVLRRLPTGLTSLSEAQAAATVRTAALIISPRTLEILAGYAADPRLRVQHELINAWEYFDPDEYARRILADAPLLGGHIRLTTRRLLPSLHHLRNLMTLSLSSEPVTELAWVRTVPKLAYLSTQSDQRLDLSPLVDHPELQYLWISAEGYEGAGALTRLTKLRELCLWQFTSTWTGLGFLRGLTDLTVLGLNGLDQPDALSPLTALPRLRRLLLHDCELTAESLTALTTVIELVLVRSAIEGGLAALATAMPQLQELVLASYAPRPDLMPLATMSLRQLDLDRIPLRDVTGLRGAAELTHLSLAHCTELTDIAALQHLPSLRHLDLRSARPGLDLAPLAGCHGLTVYLDKGQEVTGVAALARDVRVRYEGMPRR